MFKKLLSAVIYAVTLSKKTVLFLVTMIASLTLFSCNDTEIKNDTSIIKESEKTSDEKQNDYSETTINNNGNDNTFQKSQLNELANNLFREADYYFTEYESNEELIYSNVRNDDGFGREIVRQSPRVEEIEYIFIFDSNQKIETAMFWNCSDEKKYVGCSGKIKSIEEINAKNWDEVLAYYGLKEGEYINTYSDDIKESSTSQTVFPTENTLSLRL